MIPLPPQPPLNTRPMRNLKAAIDLILAAIMTEATITCMAAILLAAMIVKIMEFRILQPGRILQHPDLKTKTIPMLESITKLIITNFIMMKEVLSFNLRLRGVVHLDKRPR